MVSNIKKNILTRTLSLTITTITPIITTTITTTAATTTTTNHLSKTIIEISSVREAPLSAAASRPAKLFQFKSIVWEKEENGRRMGGERGEK